MRRPGAQVVGNRARSGTARGLRGWAESLAEEGGARGPRSRGHTWASRTVEGEASQVDTEQQEVQKPPWRRPLTLAGPCGRTLQGRISPEGPRKSRPHLEDWFPTGLVLEGHGLPSWSCPLNSAETLA